MKVFENWPQLATIVSGLTVLYSILYNIAYFAVVYPDGLQLMTLNDQLESAIQAVPRTLVCVFVGQYVGLLRPDGKRLPELTHAERQLAAEKWTWLLIFALLPFLIVYFETAEDDWIAIIPCIYLIVFATYKRATYVSDFYAQLEQSFNFLLVVVSVSVMTGGAAGSRDLSKNAARTTVFLKTDALTSDGVVLRQLERGIMLFNIPTHTIQFVPWDEVVKVTTSTNKIDERSRICRLTGFGCKITDTY